MAEGSIVVRLLYLAYSDQTAKSLPAGFELVDNRENARSDWFEYWPIRNFLLLQDLDSLGLIGFFSPRFNKKTGLSAHQIRDFINRSQQSVRGCNDLKTNSEVFIFSPQPEIVGLFRNPFYAENFFSPGFLSVSQRTFDEIGIRVALNEMVNDLQTTVYSNYIVASGRFWKSWLEITEKIFALCELNEPKAREIGLLNSTNYPLGAQKKVFLIERIATLLLTVNPEWNPKAYFPFRFPSSEVFAEFRN